MPKVSVVMPAYNAANYVREAINSILSQTFKDFEFIIINDGSTDNTAEIIQSFHDKRILFINNSTNSGISSSANSGIKIAQGEYIARMDSDDISLPERFFQQVKILDSYPELGVCGSHINLIKDGKKINCWSYPEHHPGIMVCQFFFPGFANPVSMLRKEILVNQNIKYDSKMEPCEDYDMWYKYLNFTKGYNIQKVLLKYRITETQITNSKKDIVKNKTNIIRKKYLNLLGIRDIDKNYDFHCALIDDHWIPKETFFDKAFKWICYLIETNNRIEYFDKNLFASELARRAYLKCLAQTTPGLYATDIFFESVLSDYFRPPFKKKIKSIIKKRIKI